MRRARLLAWRLLSSTRCSSNKYAEVLRDAPCLHPHTSQCFSWLAVWCPGHEKAMLHSSSALHCTASTSAGTYSAGTTRQDPRPDFTAGMLLRDIETSHSWHELAALVQQYGQEFGLPHCNAALRRLKSFTSQVPPAEQQQLEKSGLLSKLEAVCVPVLQRLNPASLSRTASDARSWPRSTILSEALAARVEAVADRMSSQHLANTLRQLTALGQPPSQRVVSLLPAKDVRRLLAKNVAGSTSMKELAELLSSEGGKFASSNVSSAFSKAASLAPAAALDTRDAAALDEVLRWLERFVREHTAAFPATTCASMLLEMRALQGAASSKGLVGVLIERLHETAQELPPRTLAQAIRGVNLLRMVGRPGDDALRTALAGRACAIVYDLDQLEVRTILAALSSSKPHALSSHNWNRLAMAAARVHGMPPASFSRVLKCLAHLRVHGACEPRADVLFCLARRAILFAPHLRGDVYADCMLVLARMGYRPVGREMAGIAAMMEQKLPEMQNDGFADGVLALAALGFEPQQSQLTAWALGASSRAFELQGRHIRRLIRALEMLGLPNQDAAWKALARRAEAVLPEEEPWAVASIAALLPALRSAADDNFFRILDDAVARSVGALSAEDLVRVQSGYAAVGRKLPPGVLIAPPKELEQNK